MSDIINIITIGILAGGLIFAGWQVLVSRRAMNAEVVNDLFKSLRKPEIISTLRAIYRYEPEDLCESLIKLSDISHSNNLGFVTERKLLGAQHIMKSLDDVLDNLELISGLVKRGVIDKELAVEAFSGSTAVRVWYMLSYYIQHERYWRGSLYGKCLEYFAKATLKHLRKPIYKFTDDDYIFITPSRNRDEKPIDLGCYFAQADKLRRPGSYITPKNPDEVLIMIKNKQATSAD